MNTATNNIPVADEDIKADAPSAAVTGNLPGATVKVTAPKGSNISVPGANSLNEEQTQAVLDRLQKYVDEKDTTKGVLNPLMKGLNLAYATTYGPDTLQRAQALYDLQDKDVQNTLSTMGSLASNAAQNKAFLQAAGTPFKAQNQAGPGGPGTMQMQNAQLSPVDTAIMSLPVAMQQKAGILKKMGTRESIDEIFKMAQEYEIKGRTSESKNAAEVFAMPEGPQKNIRLAELYKNAAGPVSTFSGGFETKTSGPLANQLSGTPTAAPAGGTGTNLGNMRPIGQSTGFQQNLPIDQDLARIDSNLKSYGDKGINTLAGVISRWSPPNENDTAQLIKNASQFLGIKPDQQIDLQNPAIRQVISTALIKQEGNLPKIFNTAAPVASRTPSGVPAGTVEGAKYSTEQLTKQNEMDRDALVKPLREVQQKNLALPNQIDNAIATLDKTKVGPGTTLKQLMLETKGTFTNLDPKDMKYLSNLRTLDSLGKKIILSDAKGSLPGSFSDSDRAYIDKTGYGINDPKDFIKATMELKKASVLANNDLANFLSRPENSGRIAEAYQQYQDSGKGMEILRKNAPTLFKYEKKEAAPQTDAQPKYSDDAARDWLAKNPNHPKAADVRKSLESK